MFDIQYMDGHFCQIKNTKFSVTKNFLIQIFKMANWLQIYVVYKGVVKIQAFREQTDKLSYVVDLQLIKFTKYDLKLYIAIAKLILTKIFQQAVE
jgi:hypothetical protein